MGPVPSGSHNSPFFVVEARAEVTLTMSVDSNADRESIDGEKQS